MFSFLFSFLNIEFGFSGRLNIFQDMSKEQYKEYHQARMEDNIGTSGFHVFFCILFTVLCSIYSALKFKDYNNKYIYEYIIIVLPLILVHTLFAELLYYFNLIIFSLLLYELSFHMDKIKACNHYSLRNHRVETITLLRGLTYLITVLCILAVDFKDFPRNLAKTERYGISLMDTGVGLFVLMSGFVQKDIKNQSLIDVIKENSKFIYTLTILGLIRYATVKHFNYQEHVTEYGVHWNFFYTLAVCKLISIIILYFTNESSLTSFALLYVHEAFLFIGIQDWVFSDVPRYTYFNANREGISSCPGYISLYLFATFMKNMLTKKYIPIVMKWEHLPPVLITQRVKLVVQALCLWLLYYCTNELRPMSRTLANASYCLYLEALFVTIVTIVYYFETVLQNRHYKLDIPIIIENVNNNGLSYFLAANLMTGAINMSMRTFSLNSFSTFIILNLYMILGIAFTVLLKNMGIKI